MAVKMKWLGIFMVLTLLLSAFTVMLPGKARSDDPGKWDNPYIIGTFVDKDGNEITMVSTPVKPPQVKMAAAELPEPFPQGATGTLTSVPAFTWVYGCSATSAGMMAGYYDQPARGYTNMYAGPANGGVCPMNNEIYWGHTHYPGATCGECPLVATHMGYDGLAVKGHVDDFWYDADSTTDPYWGAWTQHVYADCTADYMGTNQYHNWQNKDGSTNFFFNTGTNAPLYDYTGAEPTKRDGCHGMKLFFESRGYTVTSNYNQPIYGYGGKAAGFTYENFKAQIDAGRPVLIHLEGHTMLGYGYSDPSTIAIHNTWDNLDQTMTWGGTYGSPPMQHIGVTVIELAAVATYTLNTSSSSGGTVTTPGIGSFGPYSYGQVVNIAAANNSCYRFVNWTGNTTSIANTSAPSTTITMNGSYSITANFAINTYNLSTSHSAGGHINTPGEGTYSYSCGTVQNIVATAGSCDYFVNWSGTGAGSVANVSNASTTITMNDSYSITANFASMGITYNLTVSSGGNGSATPSGTTSQNCNDSVPIFANASACYKFLNWSGPDAGSVSNVNAASATILMNGSKTVQANFVLAPEDINCDGHVDLFDLVRLGLHWGETGSPEWIREDVKPDGVIDLFDLVIIGINWTG